MRIRKAVALTALTALAGMAQVGCTPDWAKENSTNFILEIAGIAPVSGADGETIWADVQKVDTATSTAFVDNTDAIVTVNALRKNNNPDQGSSPIEHIYLDTYEIRYFRTDGRNTEGVDVPYRIMGPLGNIRFHTPSAGGGGEYDQPVTVTVVRHQAKLEPPLINLKGGGGALVITGYFEITIYGHMLNGGAGLKASGRAPITFADFPD